MVYRVYLLSIRYNLYMAYPFHQTVLLDILISLAKGESLTCTEVEALAYNELIDTFISSRGLCMLGSDVVNTLDATRRFTL